MDILKDMVEHIRLDFDRTLLVDEEYTSAEERLHSFIGNELPPEKSHEIDSLINDVTNAMFHAAILYGIKYGASYICSMTYKMLIYRCDSFAEQV